jgi:hypothetical protein
MKSIESKILLRNLGFSENFFENVNKSVYVIKKEKIRKVCSENAVVKIEEDEMAKKTCREAEDLELYREAEDEYSLFPEECNPDSGKYSSSYINKESNLFGSEPLNNSKKSHVDSANRNSIEANLKIFENCSQSQINQLKEIFAKMNEPQETKIIVKAYRSKLKSKFYQIYEENSQEFREKIKHKIFHKCNFPSCGRTFASAGWLKSHFNEHMKEIKKNKFNILFENLLLNCNKINLSS